MSEDEELQKLRERRMAELQNQQAQQQDAMQQQQQAFDAQKQMLLNRILSSEARSRLANIKLARPQFAENIEMQLIQAFQSGALRNKIPLSDDQFKSILMQLQKSSTKRERKITFR